MSATRIILKITGEAFLDKDTNKADCSLIKNLALQIKELEGKVKFGLVVGGGNFFRGSFDGKALGLTPANAHYVGMLATIMNGLVLKNIFDSFGIKSSLFSAINCPEVAEYINQDKIDQSLNENRVVIFSGGTGNPFFSTDTNAILRALQTQSHYVWKATKVDGVFDKDPMKFTDAQLYKQLSHKKAFDEKLQVMDLSAISLAGEHNVKIKVFNIYEPNCLIKAYEDNNFGSIIV